MGPKDKPKRFGLMFLEIFEKSIANFVYFVKLYKANLHCKQETVLWSGRMQK